MKIAATVRPKAAVGVHRTSAPALGAGAAAGALIATQIRINASLGEWLGSVLVASLFSFATGLVVLLGIIALRPATREGLARLRSSQLPPWMYLSGAIGAANVATFTWVVPTIGTALFTVSAVTGQMIGGMLIDMVGVGARGRRMPTRTRVLGAAIAIVAIAVTQIGEPLGEVAAGLIAVAMGVNVCVALQLALNGRLNQATRDPAAATSVHFSVATLTLVLVVGIVAITGDLGVGAWPSYPWLYVGGICGVMLIALISVTARRLDVLRVALVVNGGQLVGAILLDSTVPGGPGITVWLVIGAALTLAAVAVASRPPRVAHAGVGSR